MDRTCKTNGNQSDYLIVILRVVKSFVRLSKFKIGMEISEAVFVFFQIQNSSKMTVQVIAGINILSYVQIGKPTQNALYKFHRKWYKSIGFWKMFMQLIISIVSRFEWCGAQCTHTQLSVLVSKHYGLSYIFCINKSYLYILMYSVVLSKTYAFCFSTSRSLFAFLHPSRWGKKTRSHFHK